jgi:hypothetical protein
MFIRLVVHSSHISQPLDLCVFGIFEILYKREKQMKGMKGKTQKIDKALLAFYNSAIFPMVRWSFVLAGSFFRLENVLGPVRVDETKVLEKSEVLEFPVDDAARHPETIDLPTRPGTQTRRRAPTPGPTSFATSLAASIRMSESS